jgi:hypothetical protein
MRVTSAILLLIAFTVNLAAGSSPKKDLAGKKEDPVVDTTRNNEDAFLLASIVTANKGEGLIFNRDALKKILEEGKTTRFPLGQSKQMRTIEAWFFPGTSEKRALVIGGVHGTELSSTEVARTLIQKLLQGAEHYYNVIIIPCLFPDNAAAAKENVNAIGSTANIGRYSFSSAADPNRQMPSPGKSVDVETGLDHMGREIEKENRFLLQLINMFKPQRIANIHAIRDIAHAGIYADPRTDSKSYALGFETDSSLAVEMASMIDKNGGYIPGNQVNKKPTALYYMDPVPVVKGSFQKRNFSGSSLANNRGSGISLGTWASTAISDAKEPIMNREAIRILTIEFPGYKRPDDYRDLKQKNYFSRQVELYASAIEKIFLRKYFVEEEELGNTNIAATMSR